MQHPVHVFIKDKNLMTLLSHLVRNCEKSGPAGADLGLELAVLRHVRVPAVKSKAMSQLHKSDFT